MPRAPDSGQIVCEQAALADVVDVPCRGSVQGVALAAGCVSSMIPCYPTVPFSKAATLVETCR